MLVFASIQHPTGALLPTNDNNKTTLFYSPGMRTTINKPVPFLLLHTVKIAHRISTLLTVRSNKKYLWDSMSPYEKV